MGKTHLGDLGIDGRIILECILKKWNIKVCTEFNWPKLEFSGRILWTK
jgi:hypothetical protein